MSSGPVESKVKWSSAGAAFGSFAVWLLATYIFHGQVPEPVLGLVAVLIPMAAAGLAGWKARHTFRTDREALKGVPRTTPPAHDI